MIAVDTNVLVRYFVGDDAQQSRLSTDFLEDEARLALPAFVSTVTLVEMLWVLADCYRVEKDKQRELVQEILASAHFVVEHENAVTKALALRHGDIADRIIHLVGASFGCSHTVTFDKKFARIDGVSLLTS